MEELITKLNATYAAIDAELKLYSQKANANVPSAKNHLDRAEALREEAHKITSQLCGGAS